MPRVPPASCTIGLCWPPLPGAKRKKGSLLRPGLWVGLHVSAPLFSDKLGHCSLTCSAMSEGWAQRGLLPLSPLGLETGLHAELASHPLLTFLMSLFRDLGVPFTARYPWSPDRLP